MKNILLATALVPAIAYSNVELETQTISADRIIESQISNSTIISREEIEQLQASNLSEIFLTLPGFQITKQGGNANTQSFVMNGFRSNQVLILLNGQRFGSATLGETTFNTIPADTIQRIEIVSNARSAIYGADALGGVINIITIADSSAPKTLRAAVGSQNTSQFSTALSHQANKLSVNFSAFTEKTQGFDVYEENDPDNDGSERHSIFLGTRFDIDQAQSISANIQSNRGIVDYDGLSGTGRKKDYQQQSAQLNWSYISSDLGASVQLGQSSDKSWNYGNGDSRGSADGFITENTTLESTLNLALSQQQQLMLIADYREEDIGESSADYDKKIGNVTGLGISHRFRNDLIGTEIGIRRDDATRFDENFSHSFSSEWFASEKLSIIAAINTGFKSPSFNDLYFPLADYGSFGTYQGNSDLKPEKSLNRRIAVQFDDKNTTLLASFQYSNIENKIDWRDIGEKTNTAVNLDNVLLRTASASWKQSWSHTFSSQLSYDWNHAIDLESSKVLQRQSPRNIKLSMNYSSEKISAGTLVNYLSDSYDDEDNNDQLSAYAIVDLFGSYNVSSNFKVGARINNALNRDYQTAKGYPAQERTYLIDGTFTF